MCAFKMIKAIYDFLNKDLEKTEMQRRNNHPQSNHAHTVIAAF